MTTNYTLIVHEEARHGYDRCGDGYSEPGTFEIFHSTDRTAFAAKWAEIDMETPRGGWDNFRILLDGEPYDYMDDEVLHQYGYYELEKEKDAIVLELKAAKLSAEEADRLKKQREAEVAKAKAEVAQRAAKLAQLAALKAELGVA